MDKSRNKTAYGLGVFAYLLLAIWALFFAAGCGLLTKEGYASAHFGNIAESLSFGPDKVNPGIFCYVVIALFVAALVVTIIRSVKAKRLVMIPATLALAVAMFALMELVANTTGNVPENGYVYLAVGSGSSKRAIYALAVFAINFIAFVVTAVYWLSALIACRKNAAEEARQEGARELTEEEKAQQEKDLEELIRRIVREELDKRPEVIQNFYGVAGLKEPVESKTVKQEVKEEPVKEEPVEEPVEEKKEEGPVPFVKAEKEPEPEPEPVVVGEEEENSKTPIIRIPFDERLVASEKDLKENYNELKNDILAYGVKSRLSNSGDTFRLHRKAFVKITIAGKGLKLYFALNPANYAESTIPVIDASDKAIYEETPCAFKVKSALSVRRAKQLIADVMATEGLEKAEPGKTDWVKQVRADLRAEKAAEKEAQK